MILTLCRCSCYDHILNKLCQFWKYVGHWFQGTCSLVCTTKSSKHHLTLHFLEHWNKKNRHYDCSIQPRKWKIPNNLANLAYPVIFPQSPKITHPTKSVACAIIKVTLGYVNSTLNYRQSLVVQLYMLENVPMKLVYIDVNTTQVIMIFSQIFSIFSSKSFQAISNPTEVMATSSSSISLPTSLNIFHHFNTPMERNTFSCWKSHSEDLLVIHNLLHVISAHNNPPAHLLPYESLNPTMSSGWKVTSLF